MVGRPQKIKDQRRDKPLRIRLTTQERKKLDSAAFKIGLDTSTWARMILLAAAKEQLGRDEVG